MVRTVRISELYIVVSHPSTLSPSICHLVRKVLKQHGNSERFSRKESSDFLLMPGTLSPRCFKPEITNALKALHIHCKNYELSKLVFYKAQSGGAEKPPTRCPQKGVHAYHL